MATPVQMELGTMVDEAVVVNPIALAMPVNSANTKAASPELGQPTRGVLSSFAATVVGMTLIVGAFVGVAMSATSGVAPASHRQTENTVAKTLTQTTQEACPGDTRGHRGSVVCDHDATHRVCAKIGDAETSFWSWTGQDSWCNKNLYPNAFCETNSDATCNINSDLSMPCNGLPCSYVPSGVGGRTAINCQPSCPVSSDAGTSICGAGNDDSMNNAAADGTWCICKWATAKWVRGVWPASSHSSTPSCPASIQINCGASDICNSEVGLFFSYGDYGVDLTPAHDCVKQKCASIWNACAAANPTYVVSR